MADGGSHCLFACAQHDTGIFVSLPIASSNAPLAPRTSPMRLVIRCCSRQLMAARRSDWTGRKVQSLPPALEREAAVARFQGVMQRMAEALTGSHNASAKTAVDDPVPQSRCN